MIFNQIKMFLKTNKKDEKIKIKIFSRNNNDSIINNSNTNEPEKNCRQSVLELKEYETPKQPNKKYKLKLNDTNPISPENYSNLNNNEKTEKSVFYQNNINTITNFNFIDLCPKSKKELKLKLATESFKSFNESINNMLSFSQEKIIKQNFVNETPIKNNNNYNLNSQYENTNKPQRCSTSFEFSNFDVQKNMSRNILSEDKDLNLKKDINFYLRTCTFINGNSYNNSEDFLLPLIEKIPKNVNNKKHNLYTLNKKVSMIEGDNPLELSFGEQKSKNENKNTNLTKPFNTLNKQIFNSNEKSDNYKKKAKIFNNIFKYKKIQTFDNNLTINNKSVINNGLNIEPKQLEFLSTNILKIKFPEYPTVKYSKQEINEHIKCYAVNTYKGLVHSSNEDKVSIILTISKPKSFKGDWPKCSFIALYDGKFGKNCSKFLRDKLHHYIFNNDYFPQNPKKAIIYGYEKAEKKFMDLVKDNKNEKSGSCALTILIIDNMLYVGNCGNSHGILSMNEGKKIINLNKIHNINDDFEKNRIEKSEAKIINFKNKEIIIPGKLNITRALGFSYLKNPELGGKKGIYLAIPQIMEYKINDNEFDFLILASDSIFENLSVEDSIKSIFNVINDQENLNIDNIHQLAGFSVDMLLKTSLVKVAKGNVTCIFIGFKNLENCKKKKNLSGKKIRRDSINNNNSKSENRTIEKIKKERSLRFKNKININKKVSFNENSNENIKKASIISEEEENNKEELENKKGKSENKKIKVNKINVSNLKQRNQNLKLTIREILSDITQNESEDENKK